MRVHGGDGTAAPPPGGADGGTVFLDEVGDLSPDGQAMLLRFLQPREVGPIGATLGVAVDVRVIAPTNRDLERAPASGAFARTSLIG